jgi:hypothetical protein
VVGPVAELAEGALVVAPLFFGFAAHGICIRFGLLRGLAVALDRGAMLNGHRLFGENKTWRGIVCVALGTALGFVIVRPEVPGLRAQDGRPAAALFLFGAAVGAAAMLAELPNSLLKRQLDIAPGRQAGGGRGLLFHVLDQVDVLAGAWLVLAALVSPTPARLAGSAVCVYLGHQVITVVGYGLGMRATAR